MNIALVGLPGSGKTTVGRQLARRLGLSFIDTDHVIEDRIGCSIRDFFEREGEARFRDVEQAVLQELSVGSGVVLSTGGGACLRDENRAVLRSNCRVIYLRSAPEDIFRRIRHDRSRPLLLVADPMQRLRDLFVNRDPTYRSTAHFVVETGRPSVSTLVNVIVMQLELSGDEAVSRG